MIGLNCRKVGWALFLVSLFSTLNANAASGTWTSLNDGSWTNSANWSGAVIADGAGNTANFATLDLSANTTVTLDAPRTVGSLSFADQTAPIFNWVLNTGSAGPLTLSGAAPTITVINGSATINASLAGTSGLAKAGSGLLVLSAANSYSGPTAVNVGTLDLATVTFSASSPLNISANAVVESIGTLNLSVNASSTALDINGNGLLKLVSSTNSASFPDLYFGPDHVSNTDWGARLASSLDLGSTQRFIFGKTGHNGVGQYGLNGADCQFNGSISGSGGMTFIAQNNWTSTDAMEVPFALNASNSFIGPIEIQRGSVYLGNASALVQSNALTFNPAGGNNARFFLYGNNATISDLSSSGTGSALIANGNLKTGATLTLGAATLRVVQNNNTIFGGVITDVFPEYTGSGTGTTGPLNLLKNGPALLRLTGANSYSGTTTIAAGLIQVDGTLGAGGVTVQSGGTLAGSGTLNGPVIVQPGGTIAPGSSGLGTLTISNSLTLNGTTLVEVSKTGSFLANDHLAEITSLNYGGTLIVTNVTDIHSGALSAGDGFILFTAGNYAGSFSSMTLPTLAAGLVWDTSNLTINGSIVVIDPTSRPLITTQPQNTTVSAGSATNLSVVAAGTAPLSFQWRKGTSVLQGAVGTSYSIPSASTNDAGGYSVVVTNINGGITSSVAILTVTAPGTLTNGLVVYLNFDNNLTAQGGTTNNGSIYTGGALNGPKYKNGMIGSAVTFSNTSIPGQPSDWAISLGKLEWIYSNNFSVSLWERTTSTTDGAFMGNKDWTSGADVGWVISNLDPKNLNYNAVGGTRRDIDLNPPFSDGNWHLITITFNRTANQVISYVDGVSVNTSDISPSGSASFNAGFNTLVGSSGNGLYSGAGDIDDLGVWNRVLTPQEISGIYGAGLNGQPLTGAVPGSAPVITTQPGNISVSTGSTATFTVNAGGQGTLTYQWKLNGTNLIGQTNATLSIPSVTAADQGIYTVLVNNGSGAVLSLGAVLRVYALVVSGQWDFDRGDLRATVGADMEFTGDTEAVTTFPIMSIAGQPARVMGFAANSSTQGFYVRHGAQPNGGGHFVNQYTLIMDVMFPAQSTGHWRALFQSDPFNHPGNDAEFLVGDDSSVPSPGGIGAGSQFDGQLVGDTWYRIAFAVDLTAPPGQQLSKYINGVNVGSQSLDGGVDGRYALGPTILLFTSGSTNGAYTQAGLVNSIQFINGWMSAQAIAALGGPTADGLPPGNAALKITSISRNASLLTLNWTGQDGQFQLQRSTNGAAGSWLDISPPDTNRTLTVPIISTTSFYRVKEQIPDIMVGLLPGGEESLPTRQIIRAAGQQVQFSGRPVDLILSPDKKFIYIKNINNLLVVDSSSWLLVQNLSYPASGASMHGIAVNPAGSRVYVTGAANELYEWILSTNGMASFSRTISMPSGSYPCGVAISADGTAAYVCLSIANKLAVVNLSNGSITRQINTGIAPWDVVLSPDGNTAYVSDWGGRFPVAGDQTATSAGTPVVIDSRGVASSGRISIVNLATGTETAQVETGLHPSDLELSSEGNTLYVANANSDTVTVIDTASLTVKETILVRPDPTFPYGSASDGLSISGDGKTLFVASAGNNAVAVVELPNAQHTNSMVQGFLPSGWYPGSVTTDSNYIYTVNVKGLGSRDGQPATTTWQVYAPLGTANRIPIPDLDALSKYTAQSFEDGRVPQIKQTQLVLRPGQAPVPVPARVGEPSVFQHVLYILKENKTYDQMFGDMPQGNGNPSLCIYPQFVSPNHHALAQQFVLLDNFYCNGVNSSDGHSWSTEANNTDHLEKSFGGFSRSYTFGDDPLTYSSTGFLWNNALQHGLTFRNYGEMDYASPVPSSTTWLQIYTDFTNGTKSIHYAQNIGVASLRQYSSTNVPGWNVGIPDVVRADGFIKELNAAQSNGVWASLHLLYLPNDHTGGPPTPRAQVADNDLSLGRVVEAISKSSFWSNTVIFVIEDDPQSGYDHVDGHRSLCLVISPYTKRGQVISTFYNQPGVLHTMERILGLPAMNQQDAMSPLMFDCFTNAPDFSPYTTIPNNISLAEGVTGAGPLKGKQRYYAKLVEKMDFSKPDAINDDIFNRYIWATIKGDAPYPAKFVGGHGKGLKRLGLTLDKRVVDDDD
jgi:autotransporter-associated beta strand protein/YVTN family beta-propeller protein